MGDWTEGEMPRFSLSAAPSQQRAALSLIASRSTPRALTLWPYAIPRVAHFNAQWAVTMCRLECAADMACVWRVVA